MGRGLRKAGMNLRSPTTDEKRKGWRPGRFRHSSPASLKGLAELATGGKIGPSRFHRLASCRQLSASSSLDRLIIYGRVRAEWTGHDEFAVLAVAIFAQFDFNHLVFQPRFDD